jgi:hypothetical protein
MNDDKPKKTKIGSRPTNIAPAVPTDLSVADLQDMSDEVERLLDLAELDMQRELNLTTTLGVTGEVIILVMDGTSPLATMAPPELRAQGARGYVARLMRRTELVAALERFAPQVAAAAREPLPCGHVGFLASTARTGLLRCVTCDRGLRPRTGKPS